VRSRRSNDGKTSAGPIIIADRSGKSDRTVLSVYKPNGALVAGKRFVGIIRVTYFSFSAHTPVWVTSASSPRVIVAFLFRPFHVPRSLRTFETKKPDRPAVQHPRDSGTVARVPSGSQIGRSSSRRFRLKGAVPFPSSTVSARGICRFPHHSRYRRAANERRVYEPVNTIYAQLFTVFGRRARLNGVHSFITLAPSLHSVFI